MKIIREPSVYVVGRQTMETAQIDRFLSDHGRYGIPFYLLYRPARESHVFGELLTREGLLSVIAEAAANR